VRLAQAQYLVVGLDYEGFGLSQGIHGYIQCFDTLVDDVVEFADALQGTAEPVACTTKERQRERTKKSVAPHTAE